MSNQLHVGDLVYISEYNQETGTPTEDCPWIIPEMIQYIGGIYRIIFFMDDDQQSTFVSLDIPSNCYGLVWDVHHLCRIDNLSIKQFNQLSAQKINEKVYEI